MASHVADRLDGAREKLPSTLVTIGPAATARGYAQQVRARRTLSLVAVNGWHASPECLGERFCRCGLCHFARECAGAAHCPDTTHGRQNPDTTRDRT